MLDTLRNDWKWIIYSEKSVQLGVLDKSVEEIKAGLLAGLFYLGMSVGCVLLVHWRLVNRHAELANP